MPPVAHRPPSLVEKVTTRLAQVVRENLHGDEKWLPTERELSAQMGVSRNVVREATKRLEARGLVEIQHGIGIRSVNHIHRPLNESVSWLMPDLADRLRALSEARLSVEPDVAALAAVRASPRQLGQLRELHENLYAAPDLESAVDADCAFHHAIADAAGNPVFRLLLDSLADLGRSSRVRSMGRAGRERAITQHAAVLKAIESGNAATARRAMRKHILAALDDLDLSGLENRAPSA